LGLKSRRLWAIRVFDKTVVCAEKLCPPGKVMGAPENACQLVYLSTTENRLRIPNEDRPWRAISAEKSLDLQFGALNLAGRKPIYGKQANGTHAGRPEFRNYTATRRRRHADRAVLGSTKRTFCLFAVLVRNPQSGINRGLSAKIHWCLIRFFVRVTENRH
jgi:hypothetical protein